MLKEYWFWVWDFSLVVSGGPYGAEYQSLHAKHEISPLSSLSPASSHRNLHQMCYTFLSEYSCTQLSIGRWKTSPYQVILRVQKIS